MPPTILVILRYFGEGIDCPYYCTYGWCTRYDGFCYCDIKLCRRCLRVSQTLWWR